MNGLKQLSPLRIIWYSITCIVALWGLVYCPWQNVVTLKPYTHTTWGALAAMNYGPITNLLSVVAMIVILGIFSPLKQHACVICALWCGAVTGNLILNHIPKVAYLQGITTWQGICTIKRVGVADVGVTFKIACDNGATPVAINGESILTQLLYGQTLSCSINAHGQATCKP